MSRWSRPTRFVEKKRKIPVNVDKFEKLVAS